MGGLSPLDGRSGRGTDRQREDPDAMDNGSKCFCWIRGVLRLREQDQRPHSGLIAPTPVLPLTSP